MNAPHSKPMKSQRLARWTLRLLALCCVLPCACQREVRVVKDGWGPLREMSDNPSDRRGPGKNHHGPRDLSTIVRPGDWSILLNRFEGDDHARRAADLARRLREQMRISDAWVADRGDGSLVYLGLYPSGSDPIARHELEQARRLVLDGVRPFQAVQLVQLDTPAPGTPGGTDTPQSPYDLQRFRGSMTLQIGYYDSDFGKDYQQAAERAAATLRAEGAEAYFFHGPNRSMVTVGLFSDADFVQSGAARAYGPKIKELQARYPYNLANGVTLRTRGMDGSITEQPSFIVRVP